MYHALIMAGGSGTRLWPLSRTATPKQALKLLGDRTMFQHAVDRVAPSFPHERLFVVTRAEHVDVLAEQVPELPRANFIVEPEGRGTAPAIGLGAIHLQKHDPEAVMAVLTADHFITKTEAFAQALAAAHEVAAQGPLVTLGIAPSGPATGFGYIKRGEPLGTFEGLQAYRLERFTEKPAAAAAQRMVDSGEYSWNSGMFVWRVDRILEELQRQMPAFHARLAEVRGALGTADYESVIDRVWPQVEKETIDYGVLESAAEAAVIPVALGWSDVGSWASVQELLPADESGNTVVGPHLGIDTKTTLVFGGRRLVATLGVENLIIVDTEDAVLICPQDRQQDVRQIVERLKADGGDRWL